MQLQLNRNATTGIGLSLVTGTSFILLSFLMGKENAFLLLNIDLGPASDFLFYIWANAGDGFIWDSDILHLSSNAGMQNKYTLQVSGFLL